MKFNKNKNDVFLIAEIGGNHEGDFEYAKKLTQLACDTGVDAVKFQIYTGDSLVSKVEDPKRNLHFKKFELSKDQYIFLIELCKKNNVIFTASVWDLDAIDWIDPYMEFYKIGSGDLTAFPFLNKIANIEKPIILSSGLATFKEVKESVEYIQSINKCYKNKEYLALLQCTSMYPIPDKDTNLNVMKLFERELQLTIGYSDHTIGNNAVETAVAMGAQIIEFHFTDTRENKSFRDHLVSFTPEEVLKLIEKIKTIRNLQGEKQKEPVESEIKSDHITSFRRAVYLKHNLCEGIVIKENDLVFLRPANGIDVRLFRKLIGKKTKKKITAFTALNWEDFE